MGWDIGAEADEEEGAMTQAGGGIAPYISSLTMWRAAVSITLVHQCTT
jgi:hypothetical protein